MSTRSTRAARRGRATWGGWLRARFADAEQGSAVAEFVMVAALLVFVAMAVFQVGLTLYVRNALISAASEGARYAARADSSPSLGVERTKALIQEGLSDTYGQQVGARNTTVGGVSVIEITVSAPLPVMGLLGPGGALTVSGRAFDERQVLQAPP